MTWIVENKEFIALMVSVLMFIATIVVRATPSKKDDEILDRVLGLLQGGIKLDGFTIQAKADKKVDSNRQSEEE
jgi:hypothetical protein